MTLRLAEGAAGRLLLREARCEAPAVGAGANPRAALPLGGANGARGGAAVAGGVRGHACVDRGARVDGARVAPSPVSRARCGGAAAPDGGGRERHGSQRDRRTQPHEPPHVEGTLRRGA